MAALRTTSTTAVLRVVISFLVLALWAAPVAAQREADPQAEEAAEVAVEEALDAGAVVDQNAELSWSGYWRSFWRGGQALLTLTQDGETVRGTFEPDGGTIEGTVDGVAFEGIWRQPGAEGAFTFALSPDGQSFVGRFGNGEYWNGERIEGGVFAPTPFRSDATPQDTLRAVVAAANAAAEGASGANLLLRRMFTYAGEDLGARDTNARRTLFLQLLELSTFRVYAAPEVGEAGRASFEVGPAGADSRFPIEFVEEKAGDWRILVQPLAVLEEHMGDALTAMRYADYDEYLDARRYSPRQAMQDFFRGVKDWDGSGGRELALATMDLSGIPEPLRAIGGPLAADYLRQVLDRLGYIIWQEIPNDPGQRLPFVYYEHVAGNIEIAPFEQADGSVRWLFTAGTLEAAPAIYTAIQNLPVAEGLVPPEPLTTYFALRSRLQEISPRLLQRPFLLENWQWLGLAATFLAAALLAAVASRLARLLARGAMRWFDASADTAGAIHRALGLPARALLAGSVIVAGIGELGLRQDMAGFIGGVGAALIIVGATFVAFFLVSAIGSWLAGRAALTETKVDEIAVAIGSGIAKFLVIAAGIVAAAEILGLPYEGVIAGLGVGGLALAIAARDAVSNFIGAGILMADKPFKRGDLIELNGQMGTVQDVGLRSTQIRTLDDALLTVPNSKLADDTVFNWGRLRSRRLTVGLGVTYDTPRRRIDDFVRRLESLVRAQPSAGDTLHVGLAGFGASSIDIELVCTLRTPAYGDFVTAKHRLVADIIDLAEEMGIEFAFPTRTIQVTGPSALEVLPAENTNRPSDKEQPAVA